MSRTTVRSVAACVVAAALVGTLTQAVLARGWTPRDTGAGVSQVDADPTPTPSPTTPEPTPTPELTPTPTPIATPTPFDESEASITALATIDDDGDLTTVEDRHTLDSEWDFSGDFGSAEVVFANPTSIGSEPASWFIDYEGVTRVIITDLGRDGFTLIDIECVAQSDSQEWEVDGSSVIWFPPWQAFGPSSFACEFIHAVEALGATPRITLPPTDAGGETARRVGNWPPVLLLLLVTAMTGLTLRLSRRDGRSRTTR